jgi:hypothetical protein
MNGYNLFGQKIEVFGGANNNLFHDYIIDEGHSWARYNSDFGFTAGIGLDSINISWLKLRFTLQFDNYKGKLDAADGGLGQGHAAKANINKSIISLGVFPMNFRIIKRIDLNFGFEISRLINESFEGTCSAFSIGQYSWSSSLQEKYKHYSSLTYFGLKGRISYDFNLSKLIMISPEYMYYFGLSNEFVEFPTDTKSMRHYFCIGIKKKIK